MRTQIIRVATIEDLYDNMRLPSLQGYVLDDLIQVPNGFKCHFTYYKDYKKLSC